MVLGSERWILSPNCIQIITVYFKFTSKFDTSLPQASHLTYPGAFLEKMPDVVSLKPDMVPLKLDSTCLSLLKKFQRLARCPGQ